MQEDYESDRAIQEIQDEMYREEEKRPDSPWTKINPKTRFIIAIGFGIIVLLAFLKYITLADAIIYSIVGLIVLWLLTSGDASRKELTWLECIIRIHDLLYFLQKHPVGSFRQIPKGEIRVHPIGRKQWYDGKPFKRSFRVDIFDEEIDITEMYFLEVDVFTGDIITFRHSPEGVYGNETKDVKILPSTDMYFARKREGYLGKLGGGRR